MATLNRYIPRNSVVVVMLLKWRRRWQDSPLQCSGQLNFRRLAVSRSPSARFFRNTRDTPPVVFTLRSISPAAPRSGRRLSGHRERGWREAPYHEQHILTLACGVHHPTTGRFRMAWHYWSRAHMISIPNSEDRRTHSTIAARPSCLGTCCTLCA